MSAGQPHGKSSETYSDRLYHLVYSVTKCSDDGGLITGSRILRVVDGYVSLNVLHSSEKTGGAAGGREREARTVNGQKSEKKQEKSNGQKYSDAKNKN